MNPTCTFLFTDIAGSTRQWEVEPEMRSTLEEHFGVLTEVVADNDGEIFSTMGDGIAAAFPSARAAATTALEIQRRHRRGALRVRIGLHTGEASRSGADHRGRPLNRAARIMALAHPGQILLSSVTAAVVGTAPNPPAITELGLVRLRDFDEPERVWQLDDPESPVAFPPLENAGIGRSHVPVPRSSLVGRDRDCTVLAQRLQAHRLVTLTGVGGVGKTRLAVEVARHVETMPGLHASYEACWFVDLARIVDASELESAIAKSIGAVSEEFEASCASLIGSGTSLLVLDNCEHVVAAAADAVDRLLERCPSLVVLATSREPLGVDGEFVLPVRSLDPQTTARQLFMERAIAAGAAPDVLKESCVVEVCERLDGIPLAIELAAAHVATLGMDAVVAALDDRFSLLSTGRRRAIDRHATMRSTIDWSFRLLETRDQRLFCYMSVFPNGFEMDAVRFVGDRLGFDATLSIDAMESLVQKSLVTITSHNRQQRHRMLETIRAFALEQLDRCDRRVDAFMVHSEWVASITHAPDTDACGEDVQQRALRLEREVESWRDAVIFAARSRAEDLAGRLCGPPTGYFLLARSDLADLVHSLAELCPPTHSNRRWVLASLVVSAGFGTPEDTVKGWIGEIESLDGGSASVVGQLMRWFSAICLGRVDDAIATCVAAMHDSRLPDTARDLFGSIAALEHFSLRGSREDPYGLCDRALEIAGRSDVTLHRVTALLGAAWALVGSDPARAQMLVGRAIEFLPGIPALPRITLPGSISRLLANLDPVSAAAGHLEQLEGTSDGVFVDLIRIFYGVALLRRVGHEAVESLDALWGELATSEPVSMIDFVSLARRARMTLSAKAIEEIETTVRRALREIVDDHYLVAASRI